MQAVAESDDTYLQVIEGNGNTHLGLQAIVNSDVYLQAVVESKDTYLQVIEENGNTHLQAIASSDTYLQAKADNDDTFIQAIADSDDVYMKLQTAINITSNFRTETTIPLLLQSAMLAFLQHLVLVMVPNER